jgi:glycosyltransferase involved in cell wall biosynthesis
VRVGMIAPPWLPVPPRKYGGTEAMIDSLCIGLAAQGHEVFLAAASDSTCPVTRLSGFPESQRLAMGQGATELHHVAFAYRELMAANVDVIHDHTLAGPFYRARPEAIPVVTTAHGPFTPEFRTLYSALSHDVSLVAISHHQASTATGVAIDRVIHHGMDWTDVKAGRGAGGYALFLGRMNPEKGVTQAIAIARLAGVPIKIAAKMHDVAEKEYFTSIVQPLLSRDVDYVGEVTAAQKYQLLGESVALLNPIQWNEPFGLVMIEALATGTPVVASNRGSAPEIIDHGETGFLSNSGQALAQALNRAGTFNRDQCRKVAEERFSATLMAARYAALYSELITAA